MDEFWAGRGLNLVEATLRYCNMLSLVIRSLSWSCTIGSFVEVGLRVCRESFQPLRLSFVTTDISWSSLTSRVGSQELPEVVKRGRCCSLHRLGEPTGSISRPVSLQGCLHPLAVKCLESKMSMALSVGCILLSCPLPSRVRATAGVLW